MIELLLLSAPLVLVKLKKGFAVTAPVTLVHFYRANADASKADLVILGVPDETKSHAIRKGTRKAPDVLRLASSESEFFERQGKIIPTCPMSGTFDRKKIADIGNISKQDLYKTMCGLVSKKKIPVTIGGDHSITTVALRAIGETVGGKTALLYFDAHPDFVSSTTDYYGSVLTDSSRYLDFSRSMLIGTRAAEPEELENAKKVSLEIVSPLDIAQVGVHKIAEKLKAKIENTRTYISIDLDCLDPAFAPGVSVPSPGGLSSIDLIYLLKSVVATGNVAGLDIVELSPDFDVNSVTAYVAARILSECMASIKV